MHLPIDKSISALSKQSSPFIKLFTHGSLNIELYAPHLVDDQNLIPGMKYISLFQEVVDFEMVTK